MKGGFVNATKYDVRVISELCDEVGPTLVATVSGTPVRQDVERLWLTHKGRPTPAEYMLVTFALGVYRKVKAAHGGDLARLWFTGENILGVFSPAFAIRLGLLKEVETSAARYAGEDR